jgi:hypothetical protein
MINLPQVLKVTGIGKNIEVDDPAARIARHETVDEVGADKTGTAGHQNGGRVETLWHWRISCEGLMVKG